MTDQPTKGPLIAVKVGDLICVVKKENSHLDLKEIENLRWILAAFHGPDREANARLFIRAQHMDELVKWAAEFVALEDNALKEWANESLIPWTGDEPCMVRLRRLKDILAKIDGGT